METLLPSVFALRFLLLVRPLQTMRRIIALADGTWQVSLKVDRGVLGDSPFAELLRALSRPFEPHSPLPMVHRTPSSNLTRTCSPISAILLAHSSTETLGRRRPLSRSSSTSLESAQTSSWDWASSREL